MMNQDTRQCERRYNELASSPRGAGKVTIAIFGALLVAVIYTIAQIGPIFYAYLEIESQIEQASRVASVKTDDELRRLILPQMRAQQIPADDTDLIIERYATFIQISLSYSEVFGIEIGDEFYEIHTFDFDIVMKEEL